jgi:hypothetical protein
LVVLQHVGGRKGSLGPEKRPKSRLRRTEKTEP